MKVDSFPLSSANCKTIHRKIYSGEFLLDQRIVYNQIISHVFQNLFDAKYIWKKIGNNNIDLSLSLVDESYM